jgi:hypothetical protein
MSGSFFDWITIKLLIPNTQVVCHKETALWNCPQQSASCKWSYSKIAYCPLIFGIANSDTRKMTHSCYKMEYLG